MKENDKTDCGPVVIPKSPSKLIPTQMPLAGWSYEPVAGKVLRCTVAWENQAWKLEAGVGNATIGGTPQR